MALSRGTREKMAEAVCQMEKERKRGVLVVDDEQVIRDIVDDFLSAEGFKVYVACSAKDADHILRQYESRIDIILLDLMMSEIGGLEYLQKLRKHGNQIPVIIITGFASLETQRSAFWLGADYIEKPFKVDKILFLIEFFLQNKRAQ